MEIYSKHSLSITEKVLEAAPFLFFYKVVELLGGGDDDLLYIVNLNI